MGKAEKAGGVVLPTKGQDYYERQLEKTRAGGPRCKATCNFYKVTEFSGEEAWMILVWFWKRDATDPKPVREKLELWYLSRTRARSDFAKFTKNQFFVLAKFIADWTGLIWSPREEAFVVEEEPRPDWHSFRGGRRGWLKEEPVGGKDGCS